MRPNCWLTPSSALHRASCPERKKNTCCFASFKRQPQRPQPQPPRVPLQPGQCLGSSSIHTEGYCEQQDGDDTCESRSSYFCLSMERQGFGLSQSSLMDMLGFPQHVHKCRLLTLFLKASLTSSPCVAIHGTGDQSVQPESPQMGLNPVGNGKFIRKENVEGCQMLGWVGAPDQKTGDTGRVVWVDWDLRAERTQSERAWEAPAGACWWPVQTQWELLAERGGRGSYQGLWLEEGLPCPQFTGGQVAPKSHRQQYRIAWKYLLNKGREARESPASCMHHLP